MFFSIRLSLVLLAVLGACVETEQVPFDVELTQQSCIENYDELSRVDLLVVLVRQNGSLCLHQSTEVTPGQRTSRTLEGGVLDNDEVVLAAVAYDKDDCVRCHALARVKLSSELTRYPLDLVPSDGCVVPQAKLQGLGLPLDDFPPKDCTK